LESEQIDQEVTIQFKPTLSTNESFIWNYQGLFEANIATLILPDIVLVLILATV
jgi:hypothetical protein